jgi:hypothetical protein
MSQHQPCSTPRFSPQVEATLVIVESVGLPAIVVLGLFLSPSFAVVCEHLCGVGIFLQGKWMGTRH